MGEPRRAWAGAALALGMVLAACGGGAAPTVAHLGATTTTTAATGSGPSGPTLAQATRFAACMRSHGVPGFPDPSAGPNGGFGGFQVNGNALGATQSQMQAARNACKSLAPYQGGGKPLTPAQQQAFLNWAACIRAHGVPNFPDPKFSGGGVQVSDGGTAPAPAAGNSAQPAAGPPQLPPQLQAAQKACKSKLPAGFGALGG
jgi:hypothetical protein